MYANYYMEKLYQDMQLQGYSEHTQGVYGRVVRDFLNFSRKPAESLNEQNVRNYMLVLLAHSSPMPHFPLMNVLFLGSFSASLM